MLRQAWFAIVAFWGAWLSFQVQPMIAKSLLPRFGGAASVWTVSLLFFQTALVAGYAYAHVSARLLDPARQAFVHLAAASIVAFGLHPLPAGDWIPDPARDPTAELLAMLLSTVGPAFVLSAATAPLVQRWFAAAFPDRSPYVLYAVSNAGSLAALIAYPLLVEPALDLDRQGQAWSWCFRIYVGLCAGCFFLVRRSASIDSLGVPPAAARQALPSFGLQARWTLAAAVPCVVLMATTNRLAELVASVPLLWIAPLAIYLATFIVCFRPGHRSRLGLWLCVLTAALVANDAYLNSPGVAVFWRGMASAMVLAAVGMACHGILVDSKPAAAALTTFYLMIAVGGALGGAFVGWFAPRWFDDYYEYPLGAAATIGLAVRELLRRGDGRITAAATLCALASFVAVLPWLSPRLLDACDRRLDRTVGAGYVPALDAGMVAALASATIVLVAQAAPRRRGIIGTIVVASVAAVACVWWFQTVRWSAAFLQMQLTYEIAAPWLPAVAIAVPTIVFAAWNRRRRCDLAFPQTIMRALGFDGVRLHPAWRRLQACAAAALPAAAAFCAVGDLGFFEGDRPAASALVLLPATVVWMAMPAHRLGLHPATCGRVVCGLTAAFAVWSASRRSLPEAWHAPGETLLLAATTIVIAVAMLARRTATAGRELALAQRGVGFLLGAAVGFAAVANAPNVALGVSLAVACFATASPLRSAPGGSSDAPAPIDSTRRFAAAYVPLVVAAAAIAASAPEPTPYEVARLRNFYGILTVTDSEDEGGPTRTLQHGPIMHGFERSDEFPPGPTAYYAPGSGVGQAFAALPAARPRRVAMLGLGIGTLAAYGRDGDQLRFFEIDGDVERLARTYFRFLETSRAEVSVVTGDGRLALERDPSPAYDLIVVDAFSGDAIPCHLLTLEACRMYLDRLAADGFLAVHISNTHVDLVPVINGLAQHCGLQRRFIEYRGDVADSMSVWAVLRRGPIPEQIRTEFGATSVAREEAVLWTDKHHSLLPLLRRGDGA